jgi:hypothetical protein
MGRIVGRILPGATIYLFGSAVKGVRQGDSDLDVLVITNTQLSRQRERGSLRTLLALLRHHPAPHGGVLRSPLGLLEDAGELEAEDRGKGAGRSGRGLHPEVGDPGAGPRRGVRQGDHSGR